MPLHSTQTDWSTVIKLFHWAMVLLIIGMMILGWTAKGWPISPTKIKLFFWHKSFGILILGLALLRLLWRLQDNAPSLPASTPRIERALARASHAMLYTLMVVMPISGWVVNSAGKFPFKVFGVWRLPQIVAPDKAVEELAKDVHLTLFWIFATLLLVHVTAALRHHFVLRNDVLVRMLPRLWPREAQSQKGEL